MLEQKIKMASEISKILSNEHKNILELIKILERKSEDIERGGEIEKIFFVRAINFIRNYADKFHHAKEEDILFKEFSKCAEKGCVHCNPTEQMLHEHDLGRGFVKSMEEGIKENNKEKLIKGLRGYCQLLKEHIYKEDNILYPMADEAIDKRTKATMLKKFEKIEKENKRENRIYLKIIK